MEMPQQAGPVTTGKIDLRTEARRGQERPREDRRGQKRTGEDRRGRKGIGEDRRGQEKTEGDRRRQKRPGEDRRGQEKTGEDRRGQGSRGGLGAVIIFMKRLPPSSLTVERYWGSSRVSVEVYCIFRVMIGGVMMFWLRRAPDCLILILRERLAISGDWPGQVSPPHSARPAHLTLLYVISRSFIGLQTLSLSYNKKSERPVSSRAGSDCGVKESCCGWEVSHHPGPASPSLLNYKYVPASRQQDRRTDTDISHWPRYLPASSLGPPTSSIVMEICGGREEGEAGLAWWARLMNCEDTVLGV